MFLWHLYRLLCGPHRLQQGASEIQWGGFHETQVYSWVRSCVLFWGPFLMKPKPELMFNSNEAQFGSMAWCINNNIKSKVNKHLSYVWLIKELYLSVSQLSSLVGSDGLRSIVLSGQPVWDPSPRCYIAMLVVSAWTKRSDVKRLFYRVDACRLQAMAI